MRSRRLILGYTGIATVLLNGRLGLRLHKYIISALLWTLPDIQGLVL